MGQQQAREVAAHLLRAGAVMLRPDAPFTFASGLKSPIYCDNRVLLGDVAARRAVVAAFADGCAGAEIVSGPATGGIAWAAWVSETCSLPMGYVRSSAKAHGRGQQIEGAAVADRAVMLLEDTVSTGESALQAAEALQAAGAQLLACQCIFTWGWHTTDARFAALGLPLRPIVTLPVLLQVAQEQGALTDTQRQTVLDWSANPQGWGGATG